MKFLLIAVCLVLYVAVTQGQENCVGRPSNQDCDGGRNQGVPQAPQCNPQPNRNMWYYRRDTRECLRMTFHGCFGNSNRYCSKEHCLRSCNRRN
ncbi:hypothetical protein KR200_003695 [Drosophila serrata]|nr:hypothetical protein KR200_003695 [Drosophila serrata]